MASEEPTQSLYAAIGGESPIRALVQRFYAIMDSDPVAAGIRAMHPPDLATSIEKLSLFLIGWSGGPQTYIETYGHPRLRARHLPFPIGTPEAEQWMHCMAQALKDTVPDASLVDQLNATFTGIAAHMRNKG